MTNDIIRVVLADDHTVVRAGLKAVLGGAKDIQVVGEVANGADAVAMTEKLDPDVLVMDLSMPQMDGAEATKALAAAGTRSRILILTMHSPDEALVPLLESGASGFLQKSAADRELVDAVRAVAHGDTYLQPSAARVLAGGLRKKAEHIDERTKFERLTQRERDVLRLVAQGYSAPEIGQRLFISPKTVDTYKQRIQEKLGLQHRSEYVQFALHLGLLTEE
ncbi:MAG: response regulator transcription factor [Gemmatimonadota bacterium]|nr:response regulator transcription factor [Gemmatimonadota bacterium]MDE3172621.1 response regulator transcription factor [Gemmatimonadota bacterium]MDE3215606.1 response regulator transcription factor [Gemmatimonadota bacterium]